MSSYIALWPNGDLSVLSGSSGYALYDQLDLEDDPNGCLLIPVTPNCHLMIENRKGSTAKTVTIPLEECNYTPVFYTFKPGMFEKWANGDQSETPKECLQRLTDEEVQAFFKEHAAAWIADFSEQSREEPCDP